VNCTPVKQLPNHCVPACLESVGKDAGVPISQTAIVEKFPNVFPGGVINDIGKSPDLEGVIRDLKLADSIYDMPFEGFEHLAALHKGNEILLMWQDPAKHCVRVCDCDVSFQRVTVMDPELGKYDTYDVARLKSLNARLVFFKRPKSRPLAHAAGM
jgi:hypothetical protein